MKQIVRVFSVVFMLIFVSTAQAQFLKKLTKKIQDKVISKPVQNDSVSEERNGEGINVNVTGMIYGKNNVDVSLIPNS